MIPRLISILLFFLLSPLFFIVSIAIVMDDGFPIIFKQKRVGKSNKLFFIYKFRTMKVYAPDIPTDKIVLNNNLFTRIGPLLRKYSIDELPQLINIALGNLNFVGPRPALYNQNELIKLRTEKNLHQIRPGVTGWSQINGRDKLSTHEKVSFDLYYLKNKSFFLNFKIIIISIRHVLFPKDVSH